MKFLKTISIVSFSLFLTFFGLGYLSKQTIPVHAEGPIEIYYLQDLDEIRNGLAQSYVLMNDLDFNSDSSYDQTDPDWQTKKTTWTTGSGWNPIGTSDTVYFEGNFDGGGYTISNLYINRGTTSYIGLFGSNKGTIQDIGLVDVNIRGSQYVGGLVGRSYGTVTDSYVTGSMRGSSITGGLIGENREGEIDNCYFWGDVNGGDMAPGGLVGVNGFGEISNSYVNANVTGNNYPAGLVSQNFGGKISNCSSSGTVSGGFSVGGLVGLNRSGIDAGTEGIINNSFSSSNITVIVGTGNWPGCVGGLVGYNIDNGSIVIDSYSTGNIDGASHNGIGGLVGCVQDYSKISTSYATGNVSGSYYIGGLIGADFGTSVFITNSYSLGNVTGEVDVGGFIGYSGNLTSISDSYTLNNVSRLSGSTSNRIGGFVGRNYQSSITNSYSIGSIYYEGTTDPTNKGFVGEHDTGGGWEDRNNFFDSEASNQLTTTGNATPKNTLEMQNILTFTDINTVGLDEPWDIVNKNNFNPLDPSIWYLEEEYDYPRLFWQYHAPEVLTVSSTNIKANTATLNGNLTDTDDETSLEVFFQYKTGSGDWIDTDEIVKTSTGVFSKDIPGLIPDTQYTFRTVVTWRDTGVIYGDTLTFTTLPVPVVYDNIQSNVEEIVNKEDTEKELVLTIPNTGSISFSPGLNLLANANELLLLQENLVIEYVAQKNEIRAYVNSTGLSYLSSQPAVLKFFNVSQKLGIQGLKLNNLRNLLSISVYDDSGNLVEDSTTYFNWDNVTYDSETDTLTLPVNHFSEYVLGAVQQSDTLPKTGMSIFPSILSGLLILIGYAMVLPKRTLRNHNSSVYQTN